MRGSIILSPAAQSWAKAHGMAVELAGALRIKQAWAQVPKDNATGYEKMTDAELARSEALHLEKLERIRAARKAHLEG